MKVADKVADTAGISVFLNFCEDRDPKHSSTDLKKGKTVRRATMPKANETAAHVTVSFFSRPTNT